MTLTIILIDKANKKVWIRVCDYLWQIDEAIKEAKKRKVKFKIFDNLDEYNKFIKNNSQYFY